MPGQKEIQVVWWDFLPLILVLACFASLAAANWNYESEFFQPVLDHGELNYYLGPDIFAFGLILALVSSTFFLLARESRADKKGKSSWQRVLLLGFVSLILFIVSMTIITFGPDALLESEQLNQYPVGNP
jgi:uncharacterized PurR-regulated membrane protein YhhQ (DUF165 family)